MNKYIVLLLATLSVAQQIDAFRVEYRIPPGYSKSGNRWMITSEVYDNSDPEVYDNSIPQKSLFKRKSLDRARKIELESCYDYASKGACDTKKYKQPLLYFNLIVERGTGKVIQDQIAGESCRALITYVYDNQTDYIYRAVGLKIGRAWRLSGTRLIEDKNNVGKRLTEVYPNSAAYWAKQPVDKCPNKK